MNCSCFDPTQNTDGEITSHHSNDKRARGNVSAMRDLGLNLFEGIQDRRGRSLIRRNPTMAVTWFRRAARHGDLTAAGSLGYAYDVGLGAQRNVDQAIRWYRRATKLGNATAASNLATVYRDTGNPRLAFQWWKRSAGMGNGDAAVDVGYCQQYAIGTRKDVAGAQRMFRRAIASRNISQFGREEAMYHLAVQFIDEGRLRLARPLLKQACADDDFPEAKSLLKQIKTQSTCVPCRCKRHINKALRGHATCPLHPR